MDAFFSSDVVISRDTSVNLLPSFRDIFGLVSAVDIVNSFEVIVVRNSVVPLK
jgi:hypothetical protein